MTLDEYQAAAFTTAVYPERYAILYPALGLTGEAGEIANKVQKVLRDNDGVWSDAAKTAVVKEAGDVLWFLATLVGDLGFSLDAVAAANIQKLADRKTRGVIAGDGDVR